MNIKITTPIPKPIKEWKTAPMSYAVAEANIERGSEPVIMGIFNNYPSAKAFITVAYPFKEFRLSLVDLETGEEEPYLFSEIEGRWKRSDL